MGLLDSLTGGDSPTLNVVPLDSGTTKLISDQQTRAQQSSGDLAAQANAGVKDSGNQMLQSDQSLNQEAAKSGQNPSMLSAIRNQYNNVAGKGIQQIVNKNTNNTSMARAQLIQEAAKSQMAQQQVETQNYQELANAMNQAEAARAQVLNSIFGAAGTAGGMYLGKSGRRQTVRPNTASDSMFEGAGGQSFSNVGEGYGNIG